MQTTDCLKAFSVASEEVLAQVLDRPVTSSGVQQISASPVEVMEVSVILGLAGDLEGRVLFEFSMADALAIAGAMNYDDAFEEMSSLARATLAELGNLVAGRALTIYNDAGGDLRLSPPMLLCGVGMRATDQSPVSKFRVNTPFGGMCVNLSVRESRAGYSAGAQRNGLVKKA